jgi:very-short-patch-repair endonuclease
MNPTLPKFYRLLTHPTQAETEAEIVIAAIGRPYRFQWVIWKYIVDFAFLDVKLAVEIDGSSHDSPAAKAKDAHRTAWLEKQGWTVIRFGNEDAMRRPGWVRKRIVETIRALEARNREEKDVSAQPD